MNSIPSAVIGLGQIGLGYDFDRVRGDGSIVLSHAAALDAHAGFDLAAAVDQDPEKRKRFEAKYSRPAYATLEELMGRHAIEAYAVGVPTQFHHPVCEALLAARPRAILCEKPFTGLVSLAEDLVRKAGKAGCILGVNFNRRFLPSLEGLRKDMRAGRFGEIYKGTLYYTKGIRHNGSHFIDLLGYLLGHAGEIRILEGGRNAAHGDREPDFTVRFGQAVIHVLAGREECFYMGQFELLGTRGRIEFLDGEPIRVRTASANPLFPGENILEPARALENPAARGIYHAWDGMYQALSAGRPLDSTGVTATETLRTIEEILAQISKREGLT